MKNIKFAAIAAATLAFFQIPAFAQQLSIDTRYGKLVTNSDKIITLNGKIFSDEAFLDDPKSLISKFELKDSDVLIFNVDNGKDCPAQFFIVNVTKKGATSTPTRGECGATRVEPVVNDQTISFTTQRLDRKSLLRITFKNGMLRENGRIIPNL